MRSKNSTSPFCGIRQGVRVSIALSCLASAIIFIAIPLLQEFLHFEHSTTFLPLILIFFIASFNGVLQGILGIQKRVLAYAVTVNVEVGFRLLAAVAMFSLVPYDPMLAFWIALIGACGSLFVALIFIGCAAPLVDPPSLPDPNPVPFVIATLFSALLNNAILQLVLLWPKHTLGSAESGMLVLFLRLTTLFTTGISSISSMTALFLSRTHLRTFMLLIISEVLILLLTILVIISLFGDTILAIIFGTNFTGHITLLLGLFSMSSSYGIVLMCSMYLTLLHRERLATLALSGVTITLAVSLYTCGDTSQAIAWVLFSVFTAWGVFLSLLLMLQRGDMQAVFSNSENGVFVLPPT